MKLKSCSYLGHGLLIVLTFSLTACQSMRGPEPIVETNLPATFQHANGPSIAEIGYKDFFIDSRLIKVIQLALENNRDLRTATLNIERSQQLFQISQSNQLPTIGASGSILRQNTPNTSTSFNIGLGMTAYELDLWGRVRSLKESALDRYFATASARDATQIALIGQVANTWLAYSYAHANLQLAEKTLKSQQDAYSLNKKRFKVGIDSELSVRQAQISIETARTDIGYYKTQIAQNLNALNLLIGQPISEELLTYTKVKTVSSIDPFGTGLPSDLLLNRPDLRSAAFNLSATGGNIGAAKAQLFPTIRLTGATGYASTDLNDLFKSGGFNWSIGPSLDLPIFDWGKRKLNIKIAEIDQKIALSDYEKAIQSAFKEVNDALAIRNSINTRLSAQHRLVEASRASYELSNKRFSSGIDDYFNVLDAQRNLYNAEKNLLVLEQINLNNEIELYKALGGGIKISTTDLIHIEQSSQKRNLRYFLYS